MRFCSYILPILNIVSPLFPAAVARTLSPAPLFPRPTPIAPQAKTRIDIENGLPAASLAAQAARKRIALRFAALFEPAPRKASISARIYPAERRSRRGTFARKLRRFSRTAHTLKRGALL